MARTTVLALALLTIGVTGVTFSSLISEEWNLFKVQYNKTYGSATEEKFRMKIYMENSHQIAKHNQLYEQNLVPYSLQLNKWADMLHSEFIATFNGLKARDERKNYTDDEASTFIPPPDNIVLPESVDWRKKGAVTPVKDQGQCGSCWAFSATGALEGQHFRKAKKLVSLSEQNLIDCSGKYGNQGCNGGLMDNAFKYVRDNRGIDTEGTYPYEAEDDVCRYNPKNSGATDKGYSDIRHGSEDDLKAAVATKGPISVGIDASGASFQFYSKGIYYDPLCSSGNLDHGVLVVGYGTQGNKDYWIVKNSWGESWGDRGYIKMSRNRRNNCGIASMASYPLV